MQEIQTTFNQIAGQINFINKSTETLEARDSKVMGVSALSGAGVKDAMEWMQLRLTRNKEARPPSYVIKLTFSLGELATEFRLNNLGLDYDRLANCNESMQNRNIQIWT